jgi:hypothetical protein
MDDYASVKLFSFLRNYLLTENQPVGLTRVITEKIEKIDQPGTIGSLL